MKVKLYLNILKLEISSMQHRNIMWNLEAQIPTNWWTWVFMVVWLKGVIF